MEWSVKPQPLICEVLPGFTTAAIIAGSYLSNDKATLAAVEHYANMGPVLAGGLAILFLASWVLGTLFDAVRDIAEAALDRCWFCVNWEFLLSADATRIEKVHEGWLAYYFLNGNYVVGLSLNIVISLIFRSLVPLSRAFPVLL
jgi:hypothetical protein